jgi:predicted ATPase
VFSLAGLDKPDLLPQAIAEALGLNEQAPWSVRVRLAEHLADKQLLLLLDNCEHPCRTSRSSPTSC